MFQTDIFVHWSRLLRSNYPGDTFCFGMFRGQVRHIRILVGKVCIPFGLVDLDKNQNCTQFLSHLCKNVRVDKYLSVYLQKGALFLLTSLRRSSSRLHMFP